MRCARFEFGHSAEGRPMRALLASRTDPRRCPLLMLQAGIHPGESDGKDAGFIALREMLEGSAAPGALERIAMLFVPAFNVDGHERFGRWNRPNQNGPEETGWRTTAQNLNLNRDYTKADAPEMRAMLGAHPRLGSAGVRRPARHRRRGLSARHFAAGRAHQPGRSRACTPPGASCAMR